uniref:uncharacterized protein LOC120825641 n=1 Tax=Gasterosteus aculeatus aculeatus TaxID=481459 RepID=UPI001A982444|nr:uncharacterized protein LOC120825641 [Gasterosteus aculeatus aculeatus]
MFAGGRMAGLCWGAVSLGLLLSVGNIWAHFPRPDEAQIAEIVNDLWNRYQPSYISRFKEELNDEQAQCRYPMFSLAVRIPYDHGVQRYDVSRVADRPDDVRKAIVGCDVYASETMVAATVLKWPNVLDQCPDARVPWKGVLLRCGILTCGRGMTWAEVQRECPGAVRDGRANHAESRVVDNFNTLMVNRNKDDFLLFYVLASPCDQKCASETSRFSILEKINVITEWTNYAVVFSDLFKPKNGKAPPECKLERALQLLGNQIGLQNIFRCDGSVPCTRCDSGDDVTPFCYSDDPRHAPKAISKAAPQRWVQTLTQIFKYLRYSG